jgi:signal transduction histidine kinase
MSTRDLAAITQDAERDVLVAAAIAVLVGILLTVVFVRGVVRPIVELRDVARSMAQGDLARRPALSAPGEVGDLGDALGRMAEQLEARLNALQSDDALVTAMLESLNEGVIAIDTASRVVRVNPRARELLGVRQAVPFPSVELPRDRQLRDALAAALGGTVTEPMETTIEGKLDAVRRDFVANVSHELRTPLTVINGFAETLVGDSDLNKEQHQFAEMIRSNARRMQAIVDELLDLSRIESGGWKPAPVMVDVAATANEVIAPFRSTLQQRRIRVDVDVDGLSGVYADPTALRQVLSNLVSNAVRHTEEGTITIAARREGEGVTLSVRDTGAGIPPEHLPRIFERFYRVDPGRSRAEGGTGLGLSIVRHLVEAHGGRVRAESVVRQGTTVSATFPQPST